jgi:glycosyltransferase involved in cell wall biosynthesis
MRHFELVLPAYNEGPALIDLVARVVQCARTAGYTPERFQLVLVNNGSTDATADYLQALANGPQGPWFRVVHVKHNAGYGAGLQAGLSATAAEYVGWSHADMQCDPADAFAALAVCAAAGKPTVVKGTRRGRAPRDRVVSGVFAATARALLGLTEGEINAQPKVFPRALLPHLEGAPATFAFDLYALYRAKKAGYAIETIPVNFPPRIHGASKWAATFVGRHKTIAKMVQYMWQLRRQQGPL